VEGVIELSRIEQGQVRRNLHALDVMPAVRQALDAVRPAMRDRKVTLRLEEPAEPLPKVTGDEEIIRRIVTHLVSNGVKYNHDGGSVVVSFRAEAARLVIRVADTGIGIAEDKQARLFTPFDRLGHENGTISGTGIGLTICRRLAQLTGSEIGFVSRAGEGSTFTLSLPLA